MMKRILSAAMLALPVMAAFAQTTAGPDKVTQAAATALGTMMREEVGAWEKAGITVEPEQFCAMFSEVFKGGDSGMSFDEANEFLTKLFAARKAEATASYTAEQQTFVDAAAKADGAVVTPTGLVFQVITEGEGAMPSATDKVSVNYEGRLADGTVFDGNMGQEPIEFGVSDLIPGFTEGLTMMKPGGTYRIVIPANLAYGENGVPGVIPGGSALDFTIVMHGVVK